MGWGTASNVTTNHLDSAADDPSQARAEIYAAALELQNVINGRNTANGVAGLDNNVLIPASLLPDTIESSSGQDLTLAPNTGVVLIQDVLRLTAKTVTELEALSASAGSIAYCSDGDAGTPCLAVSLGTTDSAGGVNQWYKISLGIQVSAT